jgi:hypothetical protein
MLELQLNEPLARVKEINTKYSVIESNLVQALKRWKGIKSLSNFRDVAVYEDEEEEKTGLSSMDPMKALNKTSKDFGDGLKKAVNMPGNAAKEGAMAGKLLLIYICNFHVLNHLPLIYMCKLLWNPMSVIGGLTGAVGAVTGGVKSAASGIANGVKEAANNIAQGVGLQSGSQSSSQVGVVCKANAKHAFKPNGPNQMALQKGETYDVYTRGKPGEWSIGENGSFPTDYVNFIEIKQQSSPPPSNGTAKRAMGGNVYSAVGNR